MIAEFAVTVVYTQIVVFDPSITQTELEWSEDHIAQGFTWMPGNVAFGAPDHDGSCLLQVDTTEQFQIDPQALWAVCVPFDVASTPLSIGSIFNPQTVSIPAGKYNLVFEALPGSASLDVEYAFVFRLNFIKSDSQKFAIIKQGNMLTTDKVLRKGP
ncbi:competence protein ComJ [Phyllobacterium sp. OV277]|uniref:competence protein ComJ n=1 Tax=Phyllobacterium sp. OV277 TaxID=1882772 RepID=UPI00088DD9A6|nr:competence protein ComJ [Phyllobacterium sp. OV277]SDP37416.1 Competence protein J (ComJ) [Phyllobacterium sp. OV277]